MQSISRRTSRLALVVLATVGTLGLTACDDDDEVEAEPEFVTVQLIATRSTGAADTAVINKSTNVVTGSNNALVLGATGNTVIRARYLRQDGTEDPVIANNANDFEMRFTAPFISAATGATVTVFNRTILVMGGANATARNATFELYHVGEQHTEYSNANIAVVVQ